MKNFLKIPKWIFDLLINWPIIALALWISDAFFDGLYFENYQAIFISSLILTFLNLFIKPILLLLALPLAVLSLGLIIPLLNGLFIFIVTELVDGFSVDSYLTSVFAAISLSILTTITQIAIGTYGKSISIKSNFNKDPKKRQFDKSKDEEIIIDVDVKEKK